MAGKVSEKARQRAAIGFLVLAAVLAPTFGFLYATSERIIAHGSFCGITCADYLYSHVELSGAALAALIGIVASVAVSVALAISTVDC